MDDLIQGFLREEIEGDVFELWMGISRLMARLQDFHQQIEPGARAAEGLPVKKTPAIRRPLRRKAA